MKILDITEVKLEWLDLTKLTQHKPKPYIIPAGTVGTTHVLRYIAANSGLIKLHEEDTTDAPWRVLMGMGWETMCAQLYDDMKWPAKVMTRGKIAGHPDAISWISGEYGETKLEDALCIDEFKYTARSRREKGAPATQYKDIRREWMWQGQMMSYLAMALKYFPSLAPRYNQPILGRFHIMWAMGCYERYTLDEMYVRYLIEYEREEIERHWTMMEKNEEGARKWTQNR